MLLECNCFLYLSFDGSSLSKSLGRMLDNVLDVLEFLSLQIIFVFCAKCLFELNLSLLFKFSELKSFKVFKLFRLCNDQKRTVKRTYIC